MTSGGEEFAASLTSADRAALERYAAARQAELKEEQQRAVQARLGAEAPAAATASTTDSLSLLVGEVSHGGAASTVSMKPTLAVIRYALT